MIDPAWEDRERCEPVWGTMASGSRRGVTRTLEVHGSGPPILLLHGFGDSADTWSPLVMALGARGHACVAPDLPGFGDGTRLERMPLLPQLERFVADAIRELHVRSGEPVVVAGNSLGGLLALAVAARHDLPIAGIVPIAPGGLDYPRWINLLAGATPMRRALALPIPWPRSVLTSMMSEVYLRAGCYSRAAIDPTVSRAFAARFGDMRALRRTLAIGQALAREGVLYELNLAEIDAPALILWGENDRLLNPAGAAILAATVPDADVIIVPRCGHLPQVEAPQVVAEAVESFLAVRVGVGVA